MSQPLFGLVPAGLPVVTQPSETPTPTSFVYSLGPTAPNSKPFSHVVVFLLPGVVLPDNTAAAIYLVAPPNPAQGQAAPVPQFLGGVGPGKESAIFKLGGSSGSTTDAGHQGQGQQVILGVSIEDAGSVAARIEEMAAAKAAATGGGGGNHSNLALVPASSGGGGQPAPSTLVLAQRIIKNAFNFLASFSGQAGQVEVVPLRAFEDWWRKFESRVRTDPGFLERDD